MLTKIAQRNTSSHSSRSILPPIAAVKTDSSAGRYGKIRVSHLVVGVNNVIKTPFFSLPVF